MPFQNLNSGAVLAGIGVQSPTPPNFVKYPRRPTKHDFIPFMIGDIWEVYNDQIPAIDKEVWMLVAKRLDPDTKFTVGTWVRFITGNGLLLSLTGNVGGPVFADPLNNINTIGAQGLIVTGTPINNTLTVRPNSAGNVASQFETDDLLIAYPDATGLLNTRSAIDPVAPGVFNNLNTSTPVAFGNRINVSLNSSIYQPQTNVDGDRGMYSIGLGLDIVGDRFMHAFGFNNTFLGTAAGNLTLTSVDAFSNTGIGASALQNLVTAVDNTAVGVSALGFLQGGSANSVVGVGSARLVVNANQNAVLGDRVLDAATAITNTVAVGSTALTNIITSLQNIAIGQGAGINYTGAEASTIIIGNSGIVGDANLIRIGGPFGVGLGQQNHCFITACYSNLGVGNTFSGAQAGNATLTGTGNSIFGNLAAVALTTGVNNVVAGANALSAASTSANNVALGNSSLNSLTTSAGANIAIGTSALSAITTGTANFAAGNTAAINLTGTDSNNIHIHNAGTAGDNNCMRLGSATGAGANQLNKTFIHGIRGITTGNADAVAILIDSAGQLGTISSSLRFKKNINDMGSQSRNILKLRPVTFNYKSHTSPNLEFGLIAEEVEEIFPELVSYDSEGRVETVKYHTLPVLLLNEVQILLKRIEQLEKLITKK